MPQWLYPTQIWKLTWYTKIALIINRITACDRRDFELLGDDDFVLMDVSLRSTRIPCNSNDTYYLVSLILCSPWCVKIIVYTTAWGSHLLVCTSHSHDIIIMQTYLKALNECQYSGECVSKIKSVLICNMWDVILAYPFFLWWLWEYVYCILLSSSTLKYESLAIASG